MCPLVLAKVVESISQYSRFCIFFHEIRLREISWIEFAVPWNRKGTHKATGVLIIVRKGKEGHQYEDHDFGLSNGDPHTCGGSANR